MTAPRRDHRLGPPRLAVRVLGLLLPEEVAEPFAGDLEERYGRERKTRGRMAADFWYWRQVLQSRPVALRNVFRQARAHSRATATGRSSMPVRVMEQLVRDVRLGVRGLMRSSGFALAAVVTLGLGTGAATAVFSLVEGVVLRPLPYADPDGLVSLWETQFEQGLEREPLSPVNFMDYRSLDRVFDDAAAWWRPEVNLSDEAGDAIRVSTVEVSENLFSVLGVEPVVGRTFPRDETLFGNEPEVVISHRLWRTRFDADPGAVGRTVRLNGAPFTIVGVMAPGFQFPEDTDVWQRLGWDMHQHSRGAHFMGSVARLASGVGSSRANVELSALTARLGEENPGTNGGWSVRAVPLDVEIAGVFRPGLLALLGAAALLLVIACINVANLLLARGMARGTEISVRAALGASRARLMGQLLVESGLLAMAGAAVGLATAVVGLRAFLAWSPIDIPRADEVVINPTVLGFAMLIAAATAMAFGLAPALTLSRTRLADALREGSRGGGAGKARGRARNALVVAEVALAVVLLSGAGLLIRSVVGMLNVDAGVRPAGVVTADLQLPGAQYGDWSDVAAFYARLATSIQENPGITAVGMSNVLPLDPGWRVSYGIPGAPTSPDQAPTAQYHTIDEGWVDALGIRLLAGRTFEVADDATRPPVIVVNEAFAQRHWPGRNAVGEHVAVFANGIGPLGRRLTDPAPGTEHEIIGVIANVRNASLGSDAEPSIYFTQRQFPFRNMYIFARGTAGTQNLLNNVRAEIAALDPTLPLAHIASLDRVLAAPADPPRLIMLVLVVFSGLALLLAAIGVYGILSYVVTTRHREIGIRMALGARPGAMLWMVLRQGVQLGAAGAFLGALGALATGRLLAGLLFGVQPTDPVTLGLVLVSAFVVSIVACVVPGRRAARTQPTKALRAE